MLSITPSHFSSAWQQFPLSLIKVDEVDEVDDLFVKRRKKSSLVFEPTHPLYVKQKKNQVNRLFSLPPDVLIIIYEYDPTWREYYSIFVMRTKLYIPMKRASVNVRLTQLWDSHFQFYQEAVQRRYPNDRGIIMKWFRLLKSNVRYMHFSDIQQYRTRTIPRVQLQKTVFQYKQRDYYFLVYSGGEISMLEFLKLYIYRSDDGYVSIQLFENPMELRRTSVVSFLPYILYIDQIETYIKDKRCYKKAIMRLDLYDIQIMEENGKLFIYMDFNNTHDNNNDFYNDRCNDVIYDLLQCIKTVHKRKKKRKEYRKRIEKLLKRHREESEWKQLEKKVVFSHGSGTGI